ncbi:porin [Microvirga sp. CF3016]|uniref:porin n=1 Tax=Microvirga sp. CF3016 TaxID=3110181 RepID=UPI002E788881|nr:porin [Microvirga sp. CF3016]MEE1611319.1 porin [Microvirga sp. CF3016]
MKRCVLALVLSGLALTGEAWAASSCPPGFAMLQSSDTCVRISGRVRADALVGTSRLRSADSYGTQASGRVQLDVRKKTEYGPLRAVISVGNLRR